MELRSYVDDGSMISLLLLRYFIRFAFSSEFGRGSRTKRFRKSRRNVGVIVVADVVNIANF